MGEAERSAANRSLASILGNASRKVERSGNKTFPSVGHGSFVVKRLTSTHSCKGLWKIVLCLIMKLRKWKISRKSFWQGEKSSFMLSSQEAVWWSITIIIIWSLIWILKVFLFLSLSGCSPHPCSLPPLAQVMCAYNYYHLILDLNPKSFPPTHPTTTKNKNKKFILNK